MKKIMVFMLTMMLISSCSMIALAEDPKYSTAGELYQAWYEDLPDYICGVWSTDGSSDNLTFGIQNNEAGNVGKREMLELVENDETITFVYQTFSRNYLSQVQEELLPYFEKDCGLVSTALDDQNNYIELGILEERRDDENTKEMIEDIVEEYGEAVHVAYTGEIVLTSTEGEETSYMQPALSFIKGILATLFIGLVLFVLIKRRKRSMRRNSICKLLYAVTAVLLVLFVITLAWDYSRYHTYSAPFYIYLLGRGVQFAIPGIIAFGIARSMKKKEYDIILFDLDGTLTESAEGITNSVIFALDKMGIKETDKEKLKAFVGPPLDESFMKYYGFDEERAKEAIENYRIYYKEKGIFEAPLYENVKQTLTELKDMGKNLFVATSKPEVFARQIVEHWEIAHLFTDIVGANLDGSLVKKDEVIEVLLKRNNIVDTSKVLMVGDRKHDMLGAKKHGISAIGVLYGYGDYEELKSAGADIIIEKIGDIKKFV